MDGIMTPIEDPCADMASGFLLLDVSAFSDLSYESFTTVPCIPSTLTKAEELMPRLVRVSDLSPPQLEQMRDIFREQVAGEHPFVICAWIDCDLDVGDLAEHIARFLCGPGHDGAKVLWRFFDPRAFATSISVFSHEQRQSLLGPIKSWKFTWSRNWWQVTQDISDPSPLFDFQTGWPTAQQWPTVQGTRVINKVMKRLGEGRQLASGECLHFLQAAIAYFGDGLRLNIHDETDQVEFVYLCARYGAAYRRHPKLVPKWDALTQQKITWADVRSQLHTTDFDRLDVVVNS